MERRRTDTPMMRQYLALKRQAGDALLFFRLGDFYELFLDDAETAAPLLDLVLTTRDRDTPDPVPMCGIPAHACEGYLRRLLSLGFSVAIAEQVEDPRLARGLVRREIVETVSPGLVANPDRLESARANYLAAVLGGERGFGLACIDVSTGEFRATESADEEALRAELERLDPREVLARDADKRLVADRRLRPASDADFDPGAVQRRLESAPPGMTGEETDLASLAALALFGIVARLQPQALPQVRALRRWQAREHLLLDPATRRHLEITQNLRDGSRSGTLLERVDRTCTAMGRRRLEQWLGEPPIDPRRTRERQQRVGEWLEPDRRREALRSALRKVGDLERIQTRAALPSGGPRALAALRDALLASRKIGEIAPGVPDDPGPAALARQLADSLVEVPPAAPRGEPYTGVVRDGVDPEVDRIRAQADEGQRFLAAFEGEERERTGIASLKVRYHRALGYSIEVPRSRASDLPAEYRRRQSLASRERFTTDELERWESVVLRARELAAAAEARTVEALRQRVLEANEGVRALAFELGRLDAAQSLATVAREEGWTRPELDSSLRIEIEAGRHPVVERSVPDGFVANDVEIDPQEARLLLVTGPNMSGKSTFLRQVALIVLLAQAGSHVPAARARIGAADRIFTRVGASDSLATGESTFLVEMRETSTILREATDRSLVLLDEIGRGTSTFDGLSIAWAVAEYLHDTPGLRPRTLFATHYHELSDLARTRSHVRNFHFACEEREGELLFLRRMEPGAASRSYGIEVARRADLPPEVIRRAREVLQNLERGEFDSRGVPRAARAAPAQLTLFAAAGDPLRAELRALDPERMTPVEALVALERIRRRLDEEEA
ncbi:MAG: DNA mismatch repair protein MutS [Myxococcota bacterium]